MARFSSALGGFLALQEVCGQDVFLLKRATYDGSATALAPSPSPAPALLAACANHPGCAALGITVGDCCPTSDDTHMMLACCDPVPVPSPAPAPSLAPAPSPSNVFMPNCSWAAPGWPIFNTMDELQLDSEWAHYFKTVYGEIPSFGYPICVGAFMQLAVRGGKNITKDPQICKDDSVEDGTLVQTMAVARTEPPLHLVTHISNSRNMRHAVPPNTWAEIQHVHSWIDMGQAWYFLEFGSAVWFNVGNTIVFNDHPDASKYFLNAECSEPHPSTPHTECENDFHQWWPKAQEQQLTSIQFISHNDCTCGEEGPSSWSHKRLCPTEIIDVNSHHTIFSGCSSNYKAGWAAQQDCDCDWSKRYSNCKGFGL